MSQLFSEWERQQILFDSKLKHLFKLGSFAGEKELVSAVNYALFTGGKRFRPMLVLASCLSLKKDFKLALDWALSIEMIHTYSLIHDDLPCMDNDDYRRGLPTVHKKFSEACALLAGDALLTEAFLYLAQSENYKSCLNDLIKILGQAAGYQGMIGGQANDCLTSISQPDEFIQIHTQKTAALIKAAVVGPFYIFECDQDLKTTIGRFALDMGILFQIKDDILDFEQQENDGLPSVSSLEQTQAFYENYLSKALQKLESVKTKIEIQPFLDLLQYNSDRKR